MSSSLQPHGLQHTCLLCPPLSPGVCSNSYPCSRWCCLTISSSVTPFSSCPQSFPALGSFPVSLLFSSGGQSIGTLASASVLSMNIQGWFPLGLTGLISLQSRGFSRVFPGTTIKIINSLKFSLLSSPTLPTMGLPSFLPSFPLSLSSSLPSLSFFHANIKEAGTYSKFNLNNHKNLILNYRTRLNFMGPILKPQNWTTGRNSVCFQRDRSPSLNSLTGKSLFLTRVFGWYFQT